MDRDLARRRGVSPRDIGFFRSVAELEDVLLSHGWKMEGRDGYRVFTLRGCDEMVFIREGDDVVIMAGKHDGGSCRIHEVMMIAGSLIVGASVEV